MWRDKKLFIEETQFYLEFRFDGFLVIFLICRWREKGDFYVGFPASIRLSFGGFFI